jgi:hypothetical protein
LQITAQAWWWGTTTAANAAHIHLPAPVLGTANPIVIFAVDASTTAAYGFTDLKTMTLTQTQFDAVVSGQSYFNIHTPTYGAGELRGQVWMAQSQPFTAGIYGYSCRTRGGTYDSLNVNLAANGYATVSLASFAAAGCPNSAMIFAGTAKVLVTSPGVNQFRQRAATPMDKMVQYAFSAQFIGASALLFTGCEACAGVTTIASRTKYTVDRTTAACTVAAAAACPVLQTSYGNMLVASGTPVHIQMSETDPLFATGDTYTDLTYSDAPIVASFVDYVTLFGSASAVVPSIVLVFASIIAVLMF